LIVVLRYEEQMKMKKLMVRFCLIGLLFTLSLTLVHAQAPKEDIMKPFREKMRVSRLHGEQGNLLLKQGKVDEAIAEYQQGIAILDNADLYNDLARAYEFKGNNEEALVNYRKAVENPLLPEPRFALGLALLLHKLKRDDEALPLYRMALRFPVFGRPDYQEALREVRGDADEKAFFDLRFEDMDSDGTLFAAAATTALARHQFETSDKLAGYEKALKIDPTFGPAYLYKAEALSAQHEAPSVVQSAYRLAHKYGNAYVKAKAEDLGDLL